MEDKSFWETVKLQGSGMLERAKKILHEGNVRKVVVLQGDKSIAVFPLTVGVVGTVFAPILAAIGVLVALLNDCSIMIERIKPADEDVAPVVETATEEPKENNEAKPTE